MWRENHPREVLMTKAAADEQPLPEFGLVYPSASAELQSGRMYF
jgi:hypothetical protein